MGNAEENILIGVQKPTEFTDIFQLICPVFPIKTQYVKTVLLVFNPLRTG